MDLSWLPDDTQSLIERAVEAVTRGAGEKLASVSLVGSAVRPPRHRGPHEPRLLVVLTDAPVAALANLAHQMAELTAEGLRLTVVTKRELLRGADVFALELAEYRLRHQLLAGSESLAQLFYSPSDLRHGIERELRVMLRETRDAIATSDKAVAAHVSSHVDRLVVVCHQLLVMLGEAPDDTSERVILSTVGARVSEERAAAALLEAAAATRVGTPIEPVRTLGELLVLLAAAVDYVDGLGVPSSRATDPPL